MSRAISRNGSNPFAAILSCSRSKCEQSIDLGVELDQALFEEVHRRNLYLLSKEERDAMDTLRDMQFTLMYQAPTPGGWIKLTEPNLDHPSQARAAREFCSWRCVRLFATGRENGKDV